MDSFFIITSLLKIAILLGVILFMVSYAVYAERRVSAFIQDRVGPNRVGPAGLFQPIADMFKLLLKEDFTPRAANTFYYWLAPCLAVMPAIITFAVVPFGLEEGSKVELPQRKFALLVGEPAEFRFFSSLTRKTDAAGSMLEEIPDDLEELSPIEVFLPPHGDESREEVVPVTLESNVTDTGMLELWCVAADGRRWKLEFNVRERTQVAA